MCNYIILARLCLVLFCGVLIPRAHAILYPVVTEAKISGCETEQCGSYRTTWTANILELGKTPYKPTAGQTLSGTGIHCEHGNASTGFTGCFWRGTGHGPKGTCKWYDDHLSDGCVGTWTGSHTGAEPGGECGIYTWSATSGDRKIVETPWGSLDAESVANSSRTAFCVKVQNPNRPCTISLPGEIDHGVVLPTETNIAKITGSVSCGDRPYVQFLGGDHLSLSSQVHTYLEAEVIDHTRLMITSTLNSSSAEPGQYHASAVVIVSPE